MTAPLTYTLTVSQRWVKHAEAASNWWSCYADCVYDDPTGVSPDASHFAAVAAGLCQEGTRVLVTFETRGERLRAAFLSAVKQRFTRVQRIPAESLPELYRVEHVELYELRL